MANNFRIKTPHAAVLVWNYVDRIGFDGVDNLHETEPVIISTVSCISIQTSKSKAQPDGSFQLTLAPTRNWVAALTAGSWCCIMMSNEPITEEDIKKKGSRHHVKMIGKIESVRVDTSVQEDGARRTVYQVVGIDWGHIFNSTLYVDNLIASKNDPQSQGNAAALAIQDILFANNGGTPAIVPVRDNFTSLLNIFGQKISVQEAGESINRLAKSIYNFNMPDDMVKFLRLKVKKGKTVKRVTDRQINAALNLTTGSLVAHDEYKDMREAYGFINPFSLQGQHTLWQILLENSNPALNEMLCEMQWDDEDGLYLTLYNRIKPFSYKDLKPTAAKSSGLKSYFQFVRTHEIDRETVISVNAGTNWRDKFNFIELKPEFQDFNVIANWYKQKSQISDQLAFEREGFRPLIIGTKQFPVKPGNSGTTDDVQADFDQMLNWCQLLKEWYFDTHRMLNGTIVMHGTTEYIAVGNNIRFSADLINPTPNINYSTYDKQKNEYILAHVENVVHSFGVSPEGARTYTTTIQFVRGIIVDNKNVKVGRGPLDKFSNSTPMSGDINTNNTLGTSDPQDPDPDKLRGT